MVKYETHCVSKRRCPRPPGLMLNAADLVRNTPRPSQKVWPHRKFGCLTYIHQALVHKVFLQAQGLRRKWIAFDSPPGVLAVALGHILKANTNVAFKLAVNCITSP